MLISDIMLISLETNFVCNHDYTRDRHALLELTLKKWGDTRMACVFLALNRLVEVQPASRYMIDEEGYDDFSRFFKFHVFFSRE